MKKVLNELNDFWIALLLLSSTTISYALGGISNMGWGILAFSFIFPILYSSSTLKSAEFIDRYFGDTKNYIIITKGLFYSQGLVVGLIFGWHFGLKIF